jgi:hypothetical protein
MIKIGHRDTLTTQHTTLKYVEGKLENRNIPTHARAGSKHIKTHKRSKLSRTKRAGWSRERAAVTRNTAERRNRGRDQPNRNDDRVTTRHAGEGWVINKHVETKGRGKLSTDFGATKR